MFYLHMVLCNLKRNKWKGISTVSICIFVFILLDLYLTYIYNCRIQLNELPNINPIYCSVSNLDGSYQVGIEISEDLIKNLETSTKIKDSAFSVRMIAGIGDFPIEDWKEKLNLNVAGANSITAVSGISLDDIHMEEDVVNFFTSSNPTCIINKSIMEKNQLRIGDTVTLNLYYQYYDEKEYLHYAPLELLSLEIIGTMDLFNTNTLQLPPDILIPFETVREVFHQNKIYFYADSASFYVADPLQLNAFKDEMKSFGFLESVPTAELSYDGIALTVRDTTFRTLASQLRQSIDALEGFFPFISTIVIFIGYITSFLLLNSLEQFFLIILGAFIGGGTANLILKGTLEVVTTGNIFLFSYFLGCMVALWRIGKTSVIEALFCTE